MYNIHYRFVANSMIQVLYRTFRNLNMLRVSVTMARSKLFDVLYRFIGHFIVRTTQHFSETAVTNKNTKPDSPVQQRLYPYGYVIAELLS